MGAKRKEIVRKILAARDFNSLEEWVKDSRNPLRLLFSHTYDSDTLIRYRAIEAIGRTAAFIATDNLEKVRIFVRGLIWLMTEESGGIGWHAPEAIAEICVQVPVLFDEYAKLLPQFLEEESFVPSTCAALYRIAPMSPKIIRDHVPELIILTKDEERFQTYDFDTGNLMETTIGRLAGQMVKSGD
ncbi:MAG: hypothetical protein GY854_03495 [Deltaproteobacteria bacterium]|nr:hypothetical protein [Deltaproteobacteria bacterium]